MSKRKRRRGKLPPFARIEHEMARSKAWESLSAYDIALYVHFRLKENGFNQDSLRLTYKEMEWLMCPARMKKSLDNLIEKGFIKLVQGGGLFRRANFYALSKDWKFWTDND